MIKKLLLFLFLFADLAIVTAQIKIPERPAQIPFVIDSTNTLDVYERSLLGRKIENYCRSTSTEILVMMVSSTNGNTIETYAKEIGQQWGIGKLGKDNGIVILIAKDDRKMSIQNGHGIEPILSNAKTKQIIDLEITPHFKAGDYFFGISQGLNAIFDVLKDEFTNEGNTNALQHFIVEPIPLSSSDTTETEDYTTAEGMSTEDNTAVIILLLFCLLLFIFIVVSIIRAATGRGLIGYRGTTIGGNGVQNNFYNRTRVINTTNFFSNRGSNFGSFNSNSGSSWGSSSGSSRSSGSSGSGGTFGGGGASGGW